MKVKYMVVGIIATLIIGAIYFTNVNVEKSSAQTGDSILSTYNSLSPQAKALYYKQTDQLTKPVSQRMAELDELKIGCFGSSSVLQMSASDTNLGGQCCGALKDFEGYEIQLEVIEDFIEEHGSIDFIPKDPYDLSVEQAQLLTSFDNDIVLSAAQQAVYDKAIENSHHGGPCCCKCWKWYVMSGLAKKLIVDYDFIAEDVSELWDISSSCGHEEDTNFYEHYDKNPSGHTH